MNEIEKNKIESLDKALEYLMPSTMPQIAHGLFKSQLKSLLSEDQIISSANKLYFNSNGIIILYNIWFFNDGEIRVFMILGILMGAIIYCLTLSPIFIKIDYFFMKKIKGVFTLLYNILKIPIEFMINLLKKIKNIVNFKNKKGNFSSNGE